MSSLSPPETTPSPTAAAATPKTASRREYDCPSPIRSLFGLTTYYSRLTCPVAGTQTKFLVSPSPSGSSARPRRSARDSRAAPYLAKSRIQKGHKNFAVHATAWLLLFGSLPPSRGRGCSRIFPEEYYPIVGVNASLQQLTTMVKIAADLACQCVVDLPPE
jgi:hypothetical protein